MQYPLKYITRYPNEHISREIDGYKGLKRLENTQKEPFFEKYLHVFFVVVTLEIYSSFFSENTIINDISNKYLVGTSCGSIVNLSHRQKRSEKSTYIEYLEVY